MDAQANLDLHCQHNYDINTLSQYCLANIRKFIQQTAYNKTDHKSNNRDDDDDNGDDDIHDDDDDDNNVEEEEYSDDYNDDEDVSDN